MEIATCNTHTHTHAHGAVLETQQYVCFMAPQVPPAFSPTPLRRGTCRPSPRPPPGAAPPRPAASECCRPPARAPLRSQRPPSRARWAGVGVPRGPAQPALELPQPLPPPCPQLRARGRQVLRPPLRLLLQERVRCQLGALLQPRGQWQRGQALGPKRPQLPPLRPLWQPLLQGRGQVLPPQQQGAMMQGRGGRGQPGRRAGRGCGRCPRQQQEGRGALQQWQRRLVRYPLQLHQGRLGLQGLLLGRGALPHANLHCRLQEGRGAGTHVPLQEQPLLPQGPIVVVLRPQRWQHLVPGRGLQGPRGHRRQWVVQRRRLPQARSPRQLWWATCSQQSRAPRLRSAVRVPVRLQEPRQQQQQRQWQW